MEKITLHCFPVANTRDAEEKAAQPFYYHTVGVPNEGHYIEVRLGYKEPNAEVGTLRRHVFKVIRVTWTESEIQLLLIEDRVQMREV